MKAKRLYEKLVDNLLLNKVSPSVVERIKQISDNVIEVEYRTMDKILSDLEKRYKKDWGVLFVYNCHDYYRVRDIFERKDYIIQSKNLEDVKEFIRDSYQCSCGAYHYLYKVYVDEQEYDFHDFIKKDDSPQPSI